MHFFFIFHWLSLPPRVDTGRSLHLLRCCFFLLNEVVIMRLDLLKALLTDVVLHLARILRGGLFINAETDEKFREQSVALVYFLSYIEPRFGEGQIPFLVHEKIAALFEKPDGAADARL